MIAEDPVDLGADDGVTLEGRVAVPAGATAGLVVCHPHPLYGGDLDNPVVVRVVEVAANLGLATLRFNFRGVGTSTGAHGGGTAERADVRAAISLLRGQLGDGVPLILVGYSFGARVAAEVGVDAPLAGLVLIAPPIGAGGSGTLPHIPDSLPLLVLVGSEDAYCPPEALERVRREQPRATVEVIAGANHFFFGKLYPLGEVLAGWTRQLLAS